MREESVNIALRLTITVHIGWTNRGCATVTTNHKIIARTFSKSAITVTISGSGPPMWIRCVGIFATRRAVSELADHISREGVGDPGEHQSRHPVNR